MIIDKPITWMSATTLGLGYAGEYSLLSMIEDSPEALKIATMLCSIGVLIALEGRGWLNRQSKWLFASVLGILSLIYLGFVGYAIQHSLHQIAVGQQLDALYQEGADIQKGVLSGTLTTTSQQEEWKAKATSWRDKTAAYLQDEVSPFANSKFLNTYGEVSLTYGGMPQDVNYMINTVQNSLTHLETIILSRKT
jgi:hypothetical protein